MNELSQVPEFEKPPQHVVSLVPSTTESLFALGFGSSVAGITDYCIYPADKVMAVPKVGGPKNPDIYQIVELTPELVFANQEEVSHKAVTELTDKGVRVWVPFPKTVDQALDGLRGLLAIYHTDRPAMQIETLRMAVDYARVAAGNQPRKRYFCPIWQGETDGKPWWMTFNQDTYAHDLLSVLGGENIFAGRERRYPLHADLGQGEAEENEDRDTRYPRVTTEEILAADPEVIILPNEPFNFNAEQKGTILEKLGETTAAKNKRVVFVDGSLITWHGVRMGKALTELPELFI